MPSPPWGRGLGSGGGALNRGRAARRAHAGGDYWVGIEGGIEDAGDQMMAFAWAVMLSSALAGKGRTGTFFLPEAVAKLVRGGKELGEADDLVFGKTNSKQDGGSWRSSRSGTSVSTGDGGPRLSKQCSSATGSPMRSCDASTC